ncbi:hypothetical protein BB560_003488 [Smittium megazygosporum]|uniref:cAMP-dependent protein kinase n=1 Tax=Smittium megazygosporum TaxID=133381 RepID=A0A2T9ZBV4_9FUNG|nr:hypothetical protein BB560_003488 [Smittium megazygosporum]
MLKSISNKFPDQKSKPSVTESESNLKYNTDFPSSQVKSNSISNILNNPEESRSSISSLSLRQPTFGTSPTEVISNNIFSISLDPSCSNQQSLNPCDTLDNSNKPAKVSSIPYIFDSSSIQSSNSVQTTIDPSNPQNPIFNSPFLLNTEPPSGDNSVHNLSVSPPCRPSYNPSHSPRFNTNTPQALKEAYQPCISNLTKRKLSSFVDKPALKFKNIPVSSLLSNIEKSTHNLTTELPDIISKFGTLEKKQMEMFHESDKSKLLPFNTKVLSFDNPVLKSQSLSNYDILNTLGTGTFGRVYLCREKSTSHYKAIKVLKKSQIVKLKQVEHIKNEKDILEATSHSFIVNLCCTFQDINNLYMVLEYVPGGELFSHLRKSSRFSEDTARFYAAEIVLAIEFLHSNNIVYRDMKPENILLDEHGHVKIADFGFAKFILDRTWTLCGTPEYLAPEIIQGKGHGKAVDWWAIGILIYEMIVGYPPFYDSNPFGTYAKILNGQIQFPHFISQSGQDIITSFLNIDLDHRLGNLEQGALDIKRHPWFFKIDWVKLLNRQVTPPIIPKYSFSGDTSNFELYPEVPILSPMENAIDPYKHMFNGF